MIRKNASKHILPNAFQGEHSLFCLARQHGVTNDQDPHTRCQSGGSHPGPLMPTVPDNRVARDAVSDRAATDAPCTIVPTGRDPRTSIAHRMTDRLPATSQSAHSGSTENPISDRQPKYPRNF